MADRFRYDIELPDQVGAERSPKAPQSGFVSVYGRDGKLAYKNSSGKEVTLPTEAAVPTLLTADLTVPANTQMLFTEPIDLNDQELILDGMLTEVA